MRHLADRVGLRPQSLYTRFPSKESLALDEVLGGVCPNCGGNLVARPICPMHPLNKPPFFSARP